MTFNDVWPLFIADKKLRVKPSTIATYRQTWKSLEDRFGPMDVTAVRTKAVERWCIEELSKYSKRYIHDKLTLLNNILDFVEYEFENPVSRINTKAIRWPTALMTVRDEKVASKTLTGEEIKLLIDQVAKKPRPEWMLICLMIGTGLRIGEACALTYDSINTEAKVVEVRKTLERITIDPSVGFDRAYYEARGYTILRLTKGTAVLWGPPKTPTSSRQVPLPPALLTVLKKYKSAYPGSYFIGSNRDMPAEPRLIRNHFHKLLDICGINRQVVPHSLRHTYASMLVTSGTDVRTVSELLGHSDVTTTLDIYSHASPQSKHRAVTKNLSLPFNSLAKKEGGEE